MIDFLADAARRAPDSPALLLPYFAHLGGHYARYGFGRLNAIVAALAVRLAAAGVGPGARVAVLADNSQRTIEAVYAIWRLGVVVVPLNTRWTPLELAYALDMSQAALVLCDTANEAAAREAAPLLPAYTITPSARSSLPPLPQMDEDFSGAADDFASAEVDLQAVAAILFTSGTTGKAKAAQLTFGNFAAAAEASRHRLGTGPRDRWLLTLPLYHVGGLAMVVRACMDGAPLVLMTPDRDADAIARALVNERITIVSLVPTQLFRLLQAGFEPPESLRFVLLGGAAASPGLLARCCLIGLPVATTYGMTETCSQVCTMLPDRVCAKPGSVGKPLPGLAVRIATAEGGQASANTIGVVQVSGPSLMPGYLGMEPVADFFDTGDLGYLDDDGDLWLVQRRADLIVTGGENVYPSEVEGVLSQHPAVAEACVVGLPDLEWGQRVAALVVLHPGAQADVDGLIAYCRASLAGYKIPRVIRFAEALPMTANGKVKRHEVAQLLAEAEA